MNYFIIVVAVLLITLSISIIIHPGMLKEALHGMLKKKWLWPISIVRILMGAIFMYISDTTNYPTFVGIFGLALVIAGVSIPIMGTHRIESMASWWINQKDYMLRLWGFAALLLGITLALSGL